MEMISTESFARCMCDCVCSCLCNCPVGSDRTAVTSNNRSVAQESTYDSVYYGGWQ